MVVFLVNLLFPIQSRHFLLILKQKKDICFKIAELGLRDETIYGFNLPADFFLKNYTEDISKLCEYADIIFANESEALLFCKLLNFKTRKNQTVEDGCLNLLLNHKLAYQNQEAFLPFQNH